jgi:hypothetical protein
VSISSLFVSFRSRSSPHTEKLRLEEALDGINRSVHGEDPILEEILDGDDQEGVEDRLDGLRDENDMERPTLSLAGLLGV